MRKRDELHRPGGCMARAGVDEMTFVLLARDQAAPAAIRAWVAERIRLGKNRPGDPQVVEAEHIARAMEAERGRIPTFDGPLYAIESLAGDGWSYGPEPSLYSLWSIAGSRGAAIYRIYDGTVSRVYRWSDASRSWEYVEDPAGPVAVPAGIDPVDRVIEAQERLEAAVRESARAVEESRAAEERAEEAEAAANRRVAEHREALADAIMLLCGPGRTSAGVR